MADNQNRTETPSPRRRDEARRKGQTAHSNDLTVGLSLLAGAIALQLAGATIGGTLAMTVANSLRTLSYRQWEIPATLGAWQFLTTQTWSIASIVIVVVMGVGIGAAALQAGWGFSFEPLAPQWERLSPLRGWERIWSRRSALRGVLTTIRAVAMVFLVVAVLRRDQHLLVGTSHGSLLRAISAGWTITVHVAAAIGVLLVVIGIVDYLFQRWQHEQELMMTREEVKEERKQDEGDPHMRARIKRLQRELGARMLSEVPKATVVLTNPTHFAVALRYERSSTGAPVVVAKGVDFRAQKIIEIAREHGVPVLERKPLARALYATVPVSREIPPELYQAVAEILSYLYREGRLAG